MKGTSQVAGRCRRTFEDVFQIMTVVLIETTQHDWLVGSLQLTLHIVVFSSAVRLQSQAAVRPQLSFGAKPMWRLDQRYQQSRPNRTYIRNLAERVRRGMLAALRQ